MTSHPPPTRATLLAQAKEFLQAACAICGQGMRSTHLLLICQGLELAFKAFCLDSGITLKRLRDHNEFGHDLVKLFDAAQTHGLGLNANAQASIAFINEEYVSKALNYLEPRPYYASSEESLESGLATVILEVEKHI